MNRPSVLLIDDDPIAGRLMKAVLRSEPIDLSIATTAGDGLRTVDRQPPDVVILDLRLPDMAGMEVLEKLQSTHRQLPVIILTGKVDVKTAVQAMQIGAHHYLTKPLEQDELIVVIRKALHQNGLVKELEALRERVEPAGELFEQMGRSEHICRVVERVAQVAPLDFGVLILGETGTGKELVAQMLHRESLRQKGPLVAVDCGAISEQLMESELFGYEKGAFTGADAQRRGQILLAEGGTLFLDEVANLPAALQPKLLRVLESRELRPVGGERSKAFDVRIVAATNVSLQSQVQQGRFREDLYFRLAQFTVRLPALRERPEDIPHLARRFLSELGLQLKRPVSEISAAGLRRLQEYSWPGNVRELRNVVREAVVRCPGLVVGEALIDELIGASHPVVTNASNECAPNGISLRQIGEQAAESAERNAICAVLREVGGNKSAAARQLNVDYKTLHTKIRRYRIGVDERSD